MGFFEWYKDMSELSELLESVQINQQINLPGLFSRRISLDYSLEAETNFVSFVCADDEIYSFKTHHLHLGSDFIYWSGAAQRNKKAGFEGFISYFYNLGVGSLRGKIVQEEDSMQLGIIMDPGKQVRVFPRDKLFHAPASLFALTLGYLKNKDSQC